MADHAAALIAQNPSFAALKREHQAALERPMTGATMKGDPRINDYGEQVLVRRACLYAAETLRARGILPADQSGLHADFIAPDMVRFTLLIHDNPVEVARYTIPEHIMRFSFGRHSAPVRKSLAALPPAGTIEDTAKGPEAMAVDVISVLSRYRFQLSDEIRLQGEIATALEKAGLTFEREVRIAPGSIIDFMIGDVGLEVKIRKGAKAAIYRQCERYCSIDRVKAIVLATNFSMGFPTEVAGKPAYLFSLGKAHL
jgi:hypothetical protein